MQEFRELSATSRKDSTYYFHVVKWFAKLGESLLKRGWCEKNVQYSGYNSK